MINIFKKAGFKIEKGDDFMKLETLENFLNKDQDL